MNSAQAQPDWRRALVPQNLVAAAAFTASFLVLFAFFPYASGYGAVRTNIFEFMAYVWKNPEWEHCWLVPFAVVGLVIYRRHALAALPVSGSNLGLPTLAGALFIYWVGYLADNIYLGYAALLAFTGACVLWFLGWRWLRALAFPIAFLFFMFPLPFMDNYLAFPLRILMSNLSVGFLNLVGLSCVQSGTAIVSSPDFAAGLAAGERFAVDVADPCSGIRSLFALMMVSALYAYLVMDRIWQKWIIFLASMPLAVAGNFARILMLTFGTITLGPETAIGSLEEPTFFHMASGFLVFGVALGGMLLIGWILQRFTPQKS
jgi:exosortase